MNIGITASPRLSEKHLAELKKLGKVTIFLPTKDPEELYNYCKDQDILVVWNRFKSEIIPRLKKCKLMVVWATGYDYIDIKATTKMGIAVANVPSYSTASVAEHVFTFILSLAKTLPEAHASVKSGNWRQLDFRGIEIKDKTLGIIGCGEIGTEVAKLGKAFGMKILVYTKHPENHREWKCVSFETLLKESDFITLHVPADKDTYHLINAKTLSLMKKTAFLVNTCRGSVIDEAALYEALKSKQIGGAALDVFSPEPPSPDNPLFKLDNILFTPHTAFYTHEAIERLNDMCIENVKAFLAGKPKNIVNKEALNGRIS